MGHYLDLIRDTARAEPPDDPGRDESDKSDKREVRSLMSLMSQVETTENSIPAQAPVIPEKPAPATNRAVTTWGEFDETRAIVEYDSPEPIDPTWWRDQYADRAAIRQYEGGYPRPEAELLAWGELEARWNLAHGERVSRKLCAGCRRPIAAEAALDLIDGNRVHDRDGHGCLISHGDRWRAAATQALIAMGLQPPAAYAP